MLPREYLRENAERLLAEMPERFGNAGLDTYVALDRERRDAVTTLEQRRRRRNELSALKGKPAPEALAEMKALKEEIHQLEEREKQADLTLAAVERGVPNVPQASVPRGKDETANVVERAWGTPPQFPFPAQAHWDLGPALGILDFERGVKLAGVGVVVHDEHGERHALLALERSQRPEKGVAAVAVDHDGIHVGKVRGAAQTLEG